MEWRRNNHVVKKMRVRVSGWEALGHEFVGSQSIRLDEGSIVG